MRLFLKYTAADIIKLLLFMRSIFVVLIFIYFQHTKKGLATKIKGYESEMSFSLVANFCLRDACDRKRL